ncbi:cell division protein FtsQ/DivIB [Aquifex sp.]
MLRNLLWSILGTLILIYILSIGIIKLPFLKLNSIVLEGISPGEAERIKPLLRSLGKSLIFLNEEKLLVKVNEQLQNRFKKLEINRKFTKEGVDLAIRFTRRKAIAKAFIGREVYLLSKEGKIFRDETQDVKKVIYLKGINYLDKRIIKLLDYADRIYVYKNTIKLKLEDKTVLLPLNFSTRELNLLDSAIKITDNIYKEVDLRYKRFILLRKRL